ncbi:hypothetical protein N7470_003150 [Penicillium chermesinum]|nr:hypothetical protein N7470_003150 [Penicillium chermesinum]
MLKRHQSRRVLRSRWAALWMSRSRQTCPPFLADPSCPCSPHPPNTWGSSGVSYSDDNDNADHGYNDYHEYSDYHGYNDYQGYIDYHEYDDHHEDEDHHEHEDYYEYDEDYEPPASIYAGSMPPLESESAASGDDVDMDIHGDDEYVNDSDDGPNDSDFDYYRSDDESDSDLRSNEYFYGTVDFNEEPDVDNWEEETEPVVQQPVTVAQQPVASSSAQAHQARRFELVHRSAPGHESARK